MYSIVPSVPYQVPELHVLQSVLKYPDVSPTTQYMLDDHSTLTLHTPPPSELICPQIVLKVCHEYSFKSIDSIGSTDSVYVKYDSSCSGILLSSHPMKKSISVLTLIFFRIFNPISFSLLQLLSLFVI